MAEKRAKTSTFKDYSFTKEGIKFMEPIVTVGEKRCIISLLKQIKPD
jgi:hypothetical protein